MQVVQTPSPWAMVASRWTWVPSDPADGLGLGLAQLGELVGDVGHRAVLLAQLVAHHRELPERWRRSHPSVSTRASASAGVRSRLLGQQPRAVALDEGHPAAGELHDGLVAAGLGEEAQGGDREVVVLLVEGVAAGLGEREDLRRAAAAAGAVDPALPRLDGAVLDQVVEVAAHRGGRQGQPRGEVGGAGRAVLEDRPGHALARGCVSAHGDRCREFHNTSVTLMPDRFQVRVT